MARKVHTNVRLTQDQFDGIRDRAAELTKQSATDVTPADVIRIAVTYYLRTAPPVEVRSGPDTWIRT